MADDPFPRDRVTTMLRRMPAYLRLSWRLAKDPLISRARRAAVIGAAGYLASPIDLVPGVIPVLGQLDDLAVALAAIRIALAGLSADQRRVHLDAVGLADANLADDLRTIGATTAWIGRATFRATKRVARAGSRVARVAGSIAVDVGGRAIDAGARAAGAGTRAAGLGARAASAGASAIGTGARAAGTGASALGAARSATRRRLPTSLQLPTSGRHDPEVLVTEVDVPLLPPPPPGPRRVAG